MSGKDSPSDLTNGDARKAPIPVEIHRPEPGASEALLAVLKPLVSPFTTIGIVVIFLAFFLFQREDLRNRIRLAGSNDLERTTSALDDAGRRLSRLFMTQLILNAVFGAVIGLGLAIIGVPNAPLWGLLAMALRFVPYIGAVMAAAFPIVLAAAVGDGWTMTVWTVALFAVVEPLMGQVVEPFVCGRSAGLSPVAVVVAASFWTWLWGPLGLLLSTPLTLCLVVLARHVERLGRLDDCAVLVVADALKREGINARAAGATTAIEDDKAASVCICYLQDVSKARLDYTVRKLSRKGVCRPHHDLSVERPEAVRTFRVAARQGATLTYGHRCRFRESLEPLGERREPMTSLASLG